MVLAFLCSAYDEEVLDAEKNDVRTVLRFHPALAPVKIGVLPLSKKLNEGALKLVFEQLSRNITVNLMTEETLVNVTAVRTKSVHLSV